MEIKIEDESLSIRRAASDEVARKSTFLSFGCTSLSANRWKFIENAGGGRGSGKDERKNKFVISSHVSWVERVEFRQKRKRDAIWWMENPVAFFVCCCWISVEFSGLPNAEIKISSWWNWIYGDSVERHWTSHECDEIFHENWFCLRSSCLEWNQLSSIWICWNEIYSE